MTNRPEPGAAHLGDGAPAAPTSYCRPYTSSHYAVEHSAAANGINAEIRRFGWISSSDAIFRANATYVDYSLGPRSPASRLLYVDRRHTPLPGETVFLPRGSVFAAHSEPCEQRLLCVTFAHERTQALFEHDAPLGELEPCFDVRAPRVRQVLGRLADEVRDPGFASDLLLESLALTLAVELCRHLRERQLAGAAPPGRMPDWRLKRLRARMEAGLDGALSIADLAAECGLTPRHLVRTFRLTTGATLSDTIAAARIERARQDLGDGDMAIKVIAHRCGFASAAAFSSAFRRATGVSPRQFRQDRRRLAH